MRNGRRVEFGFFSPNHFCEAEGRYGFGVYRFRSVSCPQGSVPDNGQCLTGCTCGQNLVNGQCVEMPRVNQKVWQANGDLWVYRYGVGVPCGLDKHPQHARECRVGDNGPNDNVGNPISCASGVKTQTETDYRGAGPDPLTVQRFYSSSIEENALMTPLNMMNDGYKLRLQYLSDIDIVKLHWSDGGIYVFDVPGDYEGAVGHSGHGDKGRVERTASGWDYITAGGTRYRFNDSRLLGVDRPGGHTQTLTYHQSGPGLGQIATVGNAFGASLAYHYDQQGRVSWIQLPDGSAIQYGYDSRNRLVSVTYPDDTPFDDSDNPVRRYHFENAVFPNALTGITDENGKRFATWAYDQQGKALLAEHAGGAEKVSLEYIDPTRTRVRTWQNDSTYRDEIYTFEKRGGQYRVTQIDTLPCVNCAVGSERWEYNDAGYLIRHDDADGTVTTYQRDSHGREIVRTDAVGTQDERTVVTEWHPEFALPKKITEPDRIIEYTYDENGNRLTETITDTTGLCADGRGSGCARTTTYTYNSRKLLHSVDGPRTDINDVTTFDYDIQGNRTGITNALNQVTRIPDYDPHGNPLTIIDPNGARTELRYDARQRLKTRTVAAGTVDQAVTAFEYDPAGNLSKIIQPNNAFLKYHYDPAHRLVAIEDNQGNRIDYTFDAIGNRTAETIKDPNGVLVNTQTAVYNALGQLLEQLGADSQTVRYRYDVNGNNVEITDPKAQTTVQAFDALNRLIRLDDSANGAAAPTRYEYDTQGNLANVTDPKGLITGYQYNGFGGIIQQTSPDTGITTYRYDNAGNRIAQIDARSVEVHYVYDALNRLTKIDYDGTEEDVEYVYDQGENGIGRLSAIDDASGRTEYQYDARGNITAVTTQFSLFQSNISTRYAYDNADNLTQITYPSGKIIDIDRNAISQIERIKLNGNILADNIQYQPFGPLSQLTYGNGLIETRIYDLDYRLQDLTILNVHHLAYGYDLNSNIMDIQNLLNTGQNQAFGYDALDRLIDAAGPYGLLDYAYDPVGNRLQKALTTEDTEHTEIYQYGDESHYMLQRGEVAYQYDQAGNTTHNSEFALTYNQANRLSHVHDTEGKQVAEYHYNALGLRTIKIVGTEPPDYAALADEQDAIAIQHRDNAQQKQTEADVLETRATQNEQQALANQQQAEALRQEAVEDRAGADALEPQIAELEAEARPWVERAESFRARIVEPPQNVRDRVRNAAFSLVAGIFQAVADVYLNQAEAFTAEAQALRNGADAKEQQAATLDSEAVHLLAGAEQARQDAEILQTEATGLVMLAEEAEALAAEYRAHAENPPETKETTIFVYDLNGQLFGEYSETGEMLREYVYLNGQPLAMLQGTDVFYYHSDHLDTPKALTDQNQQIVWQASYTPFGMANITGQVTNNLRFPGQYFDVETGLHYNWNRYYSALTGRYAQADSIGLEGGNNLYLYTNGNPLVFVDPDGRKGYRFQIDYGGGVGYYVVGGGIYIATIQDGSTGKICKYRITCVGGGVGLPEIGVTSKPIRIDDGKECGSDCEDFEGYGYIGGISGVWGGGVTIGGGIKIPNASLQSDYYSGEYGGIKVGISHSLCYFKSL